jgi:hypothetical protein
LKNDIVGLKDDMADMISPWDENLTRLERLAYGLRNTYITLD